ncbi:zinc-ribbon domain-containing protein [Micromonospora sp. CPCC 205371]|nr:zinc-ribbon domain-containing protein [Micromonospora sp. CPCC 205371]
MIIFGFSVFYIFGLIGSGQFACPNCGGDREYQHRTARRFFTLFFLPVIPLDKVGEVVQCQTCKVRFDPAVLQRPTSAHLAKALPAGMRAAVAAIVRAGRSSDLVISTAVDAVRSSGAPDYDVTQLQADLNLPAPAAADLLRTLAHNLTLDACERYLAEAVRVGLADGPLSPDELDCLRWIASHLGLTPAHAHGVISTVEQSTRH